jgi:hypothetical protein
MDNKVELIRVSDAEKYAVSPFLKEEVFKVDSKKKTIIAGKSSQVMLNANTGTLEGITLLHRFTEVDRERFVKIFTNEVGFLFELSKSGLKVFSYLVTIVKQDTDEVYLHIPELMEYCGYSSKNQAYRGLSELISNKIIAMSDRNNIWYINPNILFNGDRIAFIKEYRMSTKETTNNKQLPSNISFEK